MVSPLDSRRPRTLCQLVVIAGHGHRQDEVRRRRGGRRRRRRSGSGGVSSGARASTHTCPAGKAEVRELHQDETARDGRMSPIDLQRTTAGAAHRERGGRRGTASSSCARARRVEQGDEDRGCNRKERNLVGMEMGVGAKIENVHGAELDRADHRQPGHLRAAPDSGLRAGTGERRRARDTASLSRRRSAVESTPARLLIEAERKRPDERDGEEEDHPARRAGPGVTP
jgi:hypothetical protein